MSEHSQVHSGFRTLNFCPCCFGILLLLQKILLRESNWILSLHSHQLVCLATFLNVSENDSFDLYQVLTIFSSNMLGERSSVICFSLHFDSIPIPDKKNYSVYYLIIKIMLLNYAWSILYIKIYITGYYNITRHKNGIKLHISKICILAPFACLNSTTRRRVWVSLLLEIVVYYHVYGISVCIEHELMYHWNEKSNASHS